MKETWRSLAVLVALSLAACGDGENDTTVCTGTYSGAVTGRVQFCSLEATRLANGQLQYSLQIEPQPGSGTVDSSDNVLLILSGEPRTGTYTGSAISQALGSVYSTDDKQYSLQQGVGGESLGSVTLTVESVPDGQNLGNGNTLYQWFGGKAQIRYAAPASAGYTGTVDLTLDFKPQ
jgi:hypothetical protein